MLGASIAESETLSAAMITPFRLETGEVPARRDTALAAVAAELVSALRETGIAPTVLGPRTATSARPWSYKGTPVVPCFERDRWYSPFQFAHAAVGGRSQVVHLQHELYAYGGIASAFCVPQALGAMRRKGKRIITTIHGVLPLDRVDWRFTSANGIAASPAVARLAWRTLIRAVAHASDAVHVHLGLQESLLREQYDITRVPIEVIPHGVNAVTEAPPKDEARRALGIPVDAKVAMYFGFLAGYKGLDILLTEAEQLLAGNAGVYLIIAGGLAERASRSSRVLGERIAALEARFPGSFRATGFLPEELVPSAFCAADVLLLPYNVNVAASGPLHLAIAYGTPVLMSAPIAEAYPTFPGVFELERGSMTAVIGRFFADASFRREVSDAAEAMREESLWRNVAGRFAGLYRRA